MLGVLIAAAAVIAIAVVAIRKDEPVNSVDQPSSTVTASTAPHPLVGAWLIENQYLTYVMSFTSDGVVQEVEPERGALGVWEATGPNSAAVIVITPFSDDQGDGLTKWRYTWEVSPDGQSVSFDWEGADFRDGAPTGELWGPGTDTATRINVEELGAPWDSVTSVPTTSN
jgi:hypothetical protein